jgi:DNA-binding transcriptional LysR family regulator
MQMHQIRYFLALCEESNFTRAAKRSGVSQPSLTNAISALEREMGSALFKRKPCTAMTALGYAIQPYMERIAQNADQALQTAQAFRIEAACARATWSGAANHEAARDVRCSPSGSQQSLIHMTDLSEPAVARSADFD